MLQPCFGCVAGYKETNLFALPGVRVSFQVSLKVYSFVLPEKAVFPCSSSHAISIKNRMTSPIDPGVLNYCCCYGNTPLQFCDKNCNKTGTFIYFKWHSTVTPQKDNVVTCIRLQVLTRSSFLKRIPNKFI